MQAKFEDLKKADPNSKKWTETDKMQKYYAAVVKVTSPIIDSIQPLYPSKVWDDIAPKFIILFWSISMYDLEVPVDSYQKEINKIRAKNEELKNSKESVRIFFLFGIMLDLVLHIDGDFLLLDAGQVEKGTRT